MLPRKVSVVDLNAVSSIAAKTDVTCTADSVQLKKNCNHSTRGSFVIVMKIDPAGIIGNQHCSHIN